MLHASPPRSASGYSLDAFELSAVLRHLPCFISISFKQVHRFTNCEPRRCCIPRLTVKRLQRLTEVDGHENRWRHCADAAAPKCVPALAASSRSCAALVTGHPFTPRMTSPGSMPAAVAGLRSADRQPKSDSGSEPYAPRLKPEFKAAWTSPGFVSSPDLCNQLLQSTSGDASVAWNILNRLALMQTSPGPHWTRR